MWPTRPSANCNIAVNNANTWMVYMWSHHCTQYIPPSFFRDTFWDFEFEIKRKCVVFLLWKCWSLWDNKKCNILVLCYLKGDEEGVTVSLLIKLMSIICYMDTIFLLSLSSYYDGTSLASNQRSDLPLFKHILS